MKILIVTATYAPTLNGVAVSVQNFKKGLEEQGHEVWVLAPQYPGYRETEKNIVRFFSVRNPFIRNTPIPLPIPTLRILSFIKHHHFDIVHAQHPFYTGTFARLLALWYRAPLFFTYHTRYDAPFVKVVDNAASKKVILRAVDYFCHQADMVVAPSELIASYLHTRATNMNICTIASPLSDFAHASDAMPDVVAEIRRDAHAVVCLMTNRLTHEKKTHHAIDAMQYLPAHYHLIIVGDGPERKFLERKARENGVANRIHFVGFQPHGDLARFYAHADLFVFASTTETQSMSVLEAAYFGLPIVVSDSEFSRAVIPSHVSIKAPLNPELFAKAIFFAHRNRRTFSVRAREWANGFSRENQTTILLSLYEHALRVKKLAATGWQSWSGGRRAELFGSPHLYNPLRKDNYALPAADEARASGADGKQIRGWNSWAAFGTHINEEKIMRQGAWIHNHRREAPLEYVVIDDGWTRWGDWTTPDQKKFPHGLKYVVDALHAQGLRAGIWMAPFCARAKSYTARQFPSWLAYDEFDMPIDGSQFNLSLRTVFPKQCSSRLLDVREPDVWRHIEHSIDFLLGTCGFDFVKLDFLFAPYFTPGIKTSDASGAIGRVFAYIRSRYPRVYIDACGCPLMDGIGRVDAMRIGPDAVFPYTDGMGMASTFVHAVRMRHIMRAIRNRLWTKTLWALDPDAFACRKSLGIRDSDLDAFSSGIRACQGLVFVGDDLPALPRELMERFYRPLFETDAAP